MNKRKLVNNRMGIKYWWGLTINHETNNKDLAFFIDKDNVVIMKSLGQSSLGNWVVRNLN